MGPQGTSREGQGSPSGWRYALAIWTDRTTGVNVDWQRERDTDDTLATLEASVREEVALRQSINRKRSRVMDDIEALEASIRKIDTHFVEHPEARAMRLTVERLWAFATVLDDDLSASHDREAVIRKRQAGVLRASKKRRHK